MLQRTGEAETITTHYIFALGAYRTLYLFNWIYRYYFEENYTVDWIASIAGLLQTALYSDFFYIYYVKWVEIVELEDANWLIILYRVVKGEKFELPK